MTEDEWLTTTIVEAMLDFIGSKPGERKLRLFACACCRDVWCRLTPPGEPSQKALDTVEKYADGKSSLEELLAVGRSIVRRGVRAAAEQILELAARQAVAYSGGSTCENGTPILRHIVGNPFRPLPQLPHIPSTVRDLAEAVYQQEQAAVGPLHDALLDAGLTDLADHFNDAAEWHPKGCWVVDLLTGRA